MASKSLSVLGDNGAGRKTLVGCLIYTCGLELSHLDELEREGIRRFVEIVPFYERKGRIQSFHAPSGRFVVEKSKAPDVAFWVIDAIDSASWTSSAQKLLAVLSGGTLQPREKLFILVNKMDLVDWSETTFQEAVRIFIAADSKADRTYIIPISSLQGNNVVTSVEGHPWVREIGAGRVLGQPMMGLLS